MTLVSFLSFFKYFPFQWFIVLFIIYFTTQLKIEATSLSFFLSFSLSLSLSLSISPSLSLFFKHLIVLFSRKNCENLAKNILINIQGNFATFPECWVNHFFQSLAYLAKNSLRIPAYFLSSLEISSKTNKDFTLLDWLTLNVLGIHKKLLSQ